MNERLYLTTENSAIIEPIEELSRVSLLVEVQADEGLLPAGTKGTVVLVHGSGDAYIVEIEDPFHALVTVGFDSIEPIAGESRADLIVDKHANDRHS